MKEIEVGTFTKLHNLIENYDERTVIYRGMKSRNLPLIPKIGRIIPPESAKSKEWNEKEILRLFKEQALPYLDFMPDNDWDWLTLGQQYGLPTRLLDWTAWQLISNGYNQRNTNPLKDNRFAYSINGQIGYVEMIDPKWSTTYQEADSYLHHHL